MKIILFLLLNCLILSAETLEIKALKFNANEAKEIIELDEEVVITKGKDILKAHKVIININKKRQPIKYHAIGSVTFSITVNNGRILDGKSDEAFYDAIKGEYELRGNAFVNERDSVNKINGDIVILNNDSGYFNIVGSKKEPAKFIFQLGDKIEENDNLNDE